MPDSSGSSSESYRINAIGGAEQRTLSLADKTNSAITGVVIPKDPYWGGEDACAMAVIDRDKTTGVNPAEALRDAFTAARHAALAERGEHLKELTEEFRDAEKASPESASSDSRFYISPEARAAHQLERDYRDSGTTASAVLVTRDTVYTHNAGDSCSFVLGKKESGEWDAVFLNGCSSYFSGFGYTPTAYIGANTEPENFSDIAKEENAFSISRDTLSQQFPGGYYILAATDGICDMNPDRREQIEDTIKRHQEKGIETIAALKPFDPVTFDPFNFTENAAAEKSLMSAAVCDGAIEVAKKLNLQPGDTEFIPKLAAGFKKHDINPHVKSPDNAADGTDDITVIGAYFGPEEKERPDNDIMFTACDGISKGLRSREMAENAATVITEKVCQSLTVSREAAAGVSHVEGLARRRAAEAAASPLIT